MKSLHGAQGICKVNVPPRCYGNKQQGMVTIVDLVSVSVYDVGVEPLAKSMHTTYVYYTMYHENTALRQLCGYIGGKKQQNLSKQDDDNL